MGEHSFFDKIRNSMKRNELHQRRQINYGDVISVGSGATKRFGICAGETVILYGKDAKGQEVVHEESFRDFVQEVDQFAIYRFPIKYGQPSENRYSVACESIVRSQHKAPLVDVLRKIGYARKVSVYKLYSAAETVERARSQLGESSFLTSEHFALWCKTGIAESHELETGRRLCERIIIY